MKLKSLMEQTKYAPKPFPTVYDLKVGQTYVMFSNDYESHSFVALTNPKDLEAIKKKHGGYSQYEAVIKVVKI